MQISVSDRRRGEAGLTLLELLVVITILALALTAVGNLARGPGAARAVETAAQEVIGLIERARMRALATGRVTAVLVDTEAHRIRLAGTEQVIRLDDEVALAARLAAETAVAGSPGIFFFPDGTSTGGTLTLAGDGAGAEVVVDWLTGAVHATQ